MPCNSGGLGIRHYSNLAKASSRTKTEQLKAKIDDLYLQMEHTKTIASLGFSGRKASTCFTRAIFLPHRFRNCTTGSRKPVRIMYECLWQNLDGHLATKLGIERLIHLRSIAMRFPLWAKYK
jgi:hypothetical protein